jgi:hypothetical protein
MALGRTNIFRILTITWSLLALLSTLHSGASRAHIYSYELEMNIFPFNGADLVYIRLITYSLLLVGSLLSVRLLKTSAVLLLAGLLGRSYLETQSSFFVVLHAFNFEFSLITYITISLFYLCGFIAPCLLCLSQLKATKTAFG